jgi:GT2 family glycosyltransferase
MHKLTVGFIAYGELTAKYLPYFLPSLKVSLENANINYEIDIIDNSSNRENDNSSYLKKYYPEINFDWQNGKNIGFAQAHNKLMRKASAIGADYYLVLNPDISVELAAIKFLIKAMDDNKLGSVSPKILKWDFARNEKTSLIDSCGIIMKPGLRFVDIGQGEIDNGQFENPEILGPSGAAALYRISALEKVKEGESYFDEAMFMYKEDCDLAFRLSLAGYKSKCVASAKIYHDRTVNSSGSSLLNIIRDRGPKSKQQKKWSFLNQQLIYWKFWPVISAKDKFALVWRQILTLAYIILFEQFLFGQLVSLARLRKKIKVYKKNNQKQ